MPHDIALFFNSKNTHSKNLSLFPFSAQKVVEYHFQKNLYQKSLGIVFEENLFPKNVSFSDESSDTWITCDSNLLHVCRTVVAKYHNIKINKNIFRTAVARSQLKSCWG